MKDAYWFTHDANAKDDPKILMLLDQLGLEGYGIFWILIETLRDQPLYRYPVKMIPILAKRYYTSGEKMMAVVRNYELFEIDHSQLFFSPSLERRMQSLDNKREYARLAGLASAEKRKQLAQSNDRSTTVQRPLNDSSTIIVQYSTLHNNIKEENNTKESDRQNFETIKNTYQSHCSNMPAIAVLSNTRKTLIKARVKEHGLNTVIDVIKQAGKSSFLCGDNDKGWKANFDWLLNAKNFIKILEGNYANKHQQQQPLKSSNVSAYQL